MQASSHLNIQNLTVMAENLFGLCGKSTDWAARFMKDDHIRTYLTRIFQEQGLSVKKIRDSLLRPGALGVFGSSQCGKSYLVSELIRSDGEPLQVLLNREGEKSESYDYLEKINPPGGRESTAIVTRFSMDPYAAVSGCSTHVRLMSVTDLVKIFLNGFLFECQSDFLPDAEEIRKLRLAMRSTGRQTGSPGSISAEDIWELHNYVRRHFKNPFLKALEDINYWSITAEDLPFLPFDRQVSYLEWLWGRIPKISELFKRLAGALGNWSGNVVGIFSDSLLPRESSIIDIQSLANLLNPGGRSCIVKDSAGNRRELDSAVLCALTCELILKISGNKGESLLETMDILDFPGARSRAQVFDSARLASDSAALIELFIRGKVAWLFDRFSDERDITALVLCQEGGPQEAKSIPYMVNKWVEWSHGPEPENRKGKPPHLFHVFTKFDLDLVAKKGEDPNVRWESRLKTNFEEFLGQAGDWLTDWDGESRFNNCFWVRNPNVQQTVFGHSDGREIVREPAQLARIKEQYLNNAWIKKYFADPEKSWHEAATPGLSGIQFLMKRVKDLVKPQTKLDQLRENMQGIFRELKMHLQNYYVGDDVVAARDAAKERAQRRINQLAREMPKKYSLSRMLDRNAFAVSDRDIAMLYDEIINPVFDEDSEAAGSEGLNSAPVFSEDIFMVQDGKNEPSRSPANAPGRGERFSRAVMAYWQEQLLQLGQNEDFHRSSGLDGEWFAEITQEIVKGAARLNIASEMARESDKILNSPNASKFTRKVAATTAELLNRFIRNLGMPRPEVQLSQAPPKVLLTPQAYPGLALYNHWTKALISLFKDNVSASSFENEDANRLLKDIINSVIVPET